jgi:hypothetical protein
MLKSAPKDRFGAWAVQGRRKGRFTEVLLFATKAKE